MRAVWLFPILFSASPALAEAPVLIPPIDCDLAQTCYIQQFVDHDPGPGTQDFMCGGLTYDGHKGTDFALPTLAMQTAGVNVVASAPGTVRGVRDGMADVLQGSPGAPDVTNVECGNGVVIDHGNGWETQYCHMAKGSVTVEPGQTVSAGDVLGRVGLSGQTQFPHVHLSVRQSGDVIDPYTGAQIGPCTNDLAPLWADTMPTPPGGIVHAGWSSDVPDYAAVKAGTVVAGVGVDQNLVLWAMFFGGQSGDIITLSITGPTGEVFAQDIPLDRTQAQLFRAGGKRAPQNGWPAGHYTGTIEHRRGETVLDRQAITTELR